MKAKAMIRIPFRSRKHQTALLQALKPEIKRQIGARSKVGLRAERQFIVLNVEAEDTIALRAALNAYLHWINSTMSVLKTVKALS